MASFHVSCRISTPGSSGVPNEDGAGASALSAWIIDGATGVGGSNVTPDRSDAAWLASELDRRLSNATAPNLKQIEQDLAAAFDPFGADLGDADDHLAPSACLGLVSISEDGGSISGLLLGDVTVLVPTSRGIERWTDERAKPFERLTFATLGDDRSEGMSDATRQQILSNREMMNRPDGYWIVQPLRPWADNVLTFDAEISVGTRIVLASDGFMRLVDLFGAYSDATLYDALRAGHADRLMRELRELESMPGSMDDHRRVKIHDDATVIVVEVQAE